ncbi:hypothetical protein RCC89_12715 [Cytophagaceae bacterium ABcell3]|nr:hypothetical protein RCC89_12715 [Cytophagaceae bacterium ABcell3]
MNFSQYEFSVLKNTDFLITKRSILQKVTGAFDALSSQLSHHLAKSSVVLPANTRLTPKISKGENYRGLPYIVLDFPSLFSKDSLFMFRVIFLWGYAFSIEMLVSGDMLKEKADLLLEHAPKIRETLPFICISKTPWEYYYDDTIFKPCSELDKEAFRHIIENRDFVKLGARFPLEDYTVLDKEVRTRFSSLMSIIF